MRSGRSGILCILILVLPAVVLFHSCSSTTDLVLDDPAFRHDMVTGAAAGEVYRITPEDYPGIRRLFADERPSYRLAGVILGQQSGDPMFHSLIAAAALDTDSSVSGRAMEILRENPEVYRDALLAMVESSDPNLRQGGAKLLGDVGGEDLVPLLISLFADGNEDVRNQASLAVHQLTDRENPFLREALTDENSRISAMAIRTLGRFTDIRDIGIFIENFRAEKPEQRQEAQLAVLRLGRAALPELHRIATDTDQQYRVRLSALEVLQGIRSPDSLDELISLLVDDDSRISGKVESVLGTYGPEAIPALSDLYRRSTAAFRVHAVRLLARIGDESAIPVLVEALADGSDEIAGLAYDALVAEGELAWPYLRNALTAEASPSLDSALRILMNGGDPRLAITGDNAPDIDTLFLLITRMSESAIEDYFVRIQASALISETVLSLKDAWEAADDFAELEADIATGADPFLYNWRRREQLALASRDALMASFDRMHDYFDSRDPRALADAAEIRAESRRLELQAREVRALLDSMDPAVRFRGEARLETYRESRDFLVRTWEYVIPSLHPLAERVYADRGLDPRTLSRESALLE